MDTLFSDVESVTESSSSEDFEDDNESLYSGQALNLFSKLEETITKIDDLLTFERGFLHGDIVSHASDPLGPMGKVIGVSLTVDLEDIYGHKIQNIVSKDLHKLRSVSVGDYVISGAYLGKVEKIIDRLTILFDDGTKGQISLDGPEKITSLSPDVVEDPNCPYYPGQRVYVEHPSYSSSSSWLCGSSDDRSKELGTICNVEAAVIYVDWLYRAIAEDGEQRTAPPSSLQELKDLTSLPGFCSTNWQLGDWCVLRVERDSRNVRFPGLIEGQRMTAQASIVDSDVQQFAVIVKTKAKVDVLWQDGSKSLGLDSWFLSPVSVVDGHDFWPDTFVLQKGNFDDSNGDGSQRWGVAKSVDSKERTVTVQWRNSSPESEEIASAYELIEHPDYNCVGQIACRKVGFSGEKFAENKTTSNVCMEEDEDRCNDFGSKFLSYFGTVVGAEQGRLQVKWANGDITKVEPYEIYRIEAASFIMPAVEDATPTVLGSDGYEKTQILGNENPRAEDKPLSEKLKDIFTSITSSLFRSIGEAQNGNTYERTTAEDLQNPRQLLDGEGDMPEKMIMQGTKEVNEDNLLPSSFNQFDLLGDCPDHHFASQSEMDVQSPQTKRRWLRKVRQEWSILEKDLPETIYVRVYEEKMQLIRAAIVGPAGTPYHDLLFFFDVYLPPEYPNEPPMVYYNSGGLRINPNLYESGKVCLSLLNTWAGTQCEVWNAQSSTILQVLVSIQGLVLNGRPYFNEAGFDSQIGKPEGEKNSLSYNENAFLVSCKSMLYLLKKPPKGFEELVDEHFRRRGKDVLKACREYMRGAAIGCQFDSANMEGEVNLNGNSKGFKIALAKIFPKLVEAFTDKGVDCGEFLNQVS